MTPAELQSEWDYKYMERLGIMCGPDTPTPDQKRIAFDEAEAAVKKLVDSTQTPDHE